MNLNIVKTEIPGCFELIFDPLKDSRGSFVKTFHTEVFKQLNIKIHVAEEFFTYSVKNTFRGLHFQVPPMALEKIVYCLSGKVTNFVVDLRVGSPTYTKCLSFDLEGDLASAIFIPPGVAHGFYVKSDHAIMYYKASQTYAPTCDTGISYTTFDFAKQIINPIMSERDLKFVTIDQFESPFKF